MHFIADLPGFCFPRPINARHAFSHDQSLGKLSSHSSIDSPGHPASIMAARTAPRIRSLTMGGAPPAAKKSIAILGGGMAGLAVAHQLLARNLKTYP